MKNILSICEHDAVLPIPYCTLKVEERSLALWANFSGSCVQSESYMYLLTGFSLLRAKFGSLAYFFSLLVVFWIENSVLDSNASYVLKLLSSAKLNVQTECWTLDAEFSRNILLFIFRLVNSNKNPPNFKQSHSEFFRTENLNTVEDFKS